jgi:hypothetical protein
MGIDSGLPDFRGADGFWKAYPALKQQNRNFKEIANPESFNTMPEIAWGFYGHRLQLYRNTIPHAGFHILKNGARDYHGGIASLRAMWMVSFRRRDFYRVASMNATVRFTTCSAKRHVRHILVVQRISFHNWTSKTASYSMLRLSVSIAVVLRDRIF